MSWAKLDDRFHGNRKVRRAWKRNRASVGLYALALTYAAQHETDGIVDAEFLDDLMPKPAERDAAVQTLVDTGLWEVAGDDYRIHDYLEYHHSAADAEAKRESKAERQRKWREKQVGSASHDAPTDGSTDGYVDGPVAPAPTTPNPTETRPDLLAATPQRARADTVSRSLAETVKCPRCGVAPGEKCDGVRAKRESCHLERHHAVGELLDLPKDKPLARRGRSGPDASRPAWKPDPQAVAIRDEHFPDQEVTAVQSSMSMLLFRRQEVTVEAIRVLLYGGTDKGEEAA